MKIGLSNSNTQIGQGRKKVQLEEINKVGLKFQSSLAHYEAKEEYLKELAERVDSAEDLLQAKGERFI